MPENDVSWPELEYEWIWDNYAPPVHNARCDESLASLASTCVDPLAIWKTFSGQDRHDKPSASSRKLPVLLLE